MIAWLALATGVSRLTSTFQDCDDLCAVRIDDRDLVLCHKVSVGFESRDLLTQHIGEGAETRPARDTHALRQATDSQLRLGRQIKVRDDKGTVVVAELKGRRRLPALGARCHRRVRLM